MADEPTYEGMLAEVTDARQRDPRVPTGIRLGVAQRDAIAASLRAATGLDDVGPLTQFAGLEVLPSRSGDRLDLVYSEDAEPTPEPVPSGPDAPATAEQPSA
jgi:hypothetical protein